VVWGAAPEDTRVTLDGVELPAIYHYSGARSLVHGDLVRSVELMPGGYGASYGRGTGGLVRVDTRDPPQDRIHASAQLDVLDASAAAQGPISKQVLANASFRKSHLAWAWDRVTREDPGEYFPIPSYWDASARIRYQHDARSFVEIGALASSDRVKRTISSVDPSERKSQTRSLDFQRVFVRYVREPGDGARIVLLPWVGRDERALVADFSGTPTELRSETKIVGLRASYAGRVHSSLTASVGLDLKFTRSELRRAGSISSPPREGDASVFGQAPSDQINVDEWRATQGSAAPYVEADFSPWKDALHVVAGLRVEPMFQSVSKRIPSDGASPEVGAFSADVALEPRLSLRYAPSKRR